MELTVKNESITIKEVEVESVTRSSLVLIGDADVITCSSIFDTPVHSLIREQKGAGEKQTTNSATMRLGSDFFREAGELE
ncbi:hypothetical protein ACTID9_18695 [Brevibacillus fluminis]|uniref:hypothetical protein n=1 Tax=Brevibacillus fluminis TaxID=511487 RepID=UPI003F8A9692